MVSIWCFSGVGEFLNTMEIPDAAVRSSNQRESPAAIAHSTRMLAMAQRMPI
jgi:hypothetical protein